MASRDHAKHFLPIRLPFLLTDAADLEQLVQRGRSRLGNGLQRGVVEDDIGGQVVCACDFAPPRFQRVKACQRNAFQ